MFKGKGKCHKGCTELGRVDGGVCGSQRGNRGDTIEPGKSCNEQDRARPKTDPPESTSRQQEDHNDRQAKTRPTRDPPRSTSGLKNKQDQAQQTRDMQENKADSQE